jgi:hypothetical protein
MKKEKVDELTAALSSAGFELVSLKEETHRHIALENDAGSTFLATEGFGLVTDKKTGIVLLEIKPLGF